MRVLVFGASITQGFWDTQGGWVQRLRRYYDELSVKDLRQQEKYPNIFNLGISADTSTDLLARFGHEVSARLRPSREGAIVISIGTNNAKVEGQSEWPGLETFKNDLANLLEEVRAYTDKIMLIEQIPCIEKETTPVFWKDISYTNDRIKAVNSALRELAAQHNVKFVEVFELFWDEMEKERNLFADGLHPNDEGHQLMFEIIEPKLDELLELS